MNRTQSCANVWIKYTRTKMQTRYLVVIGGYLHCCTQYVKRNHDWEVLPGRQSRTMELRKTQTQDNYSPGRNLISEPPEYDARVLTTG